jgi:hypothetical protein
MVPSLDCMVAGIAYQVTQCHIPHNSYHHLFCIKSLLSVFYYMVLVYCSWGFLCWLLGTTEHYSESQFVTLIFLLQPHCRISYISVRYVWCAMDITSVLCPLSSWTLWESASSICEHRWRKLKLSRRLHHKIGVPEKCITDHWNFKVEKVIAGPCPQHAGQRFTINN